MHIKCTGLQLWVLPHLPTPQPLLYCQNHSILSPSVREKKIFYRLCILFCIQNIENIITYMVLQITAPVSPSPSWTSSCYESTQVSLLAHVSAHTRGLPVARLHTYAAFRGLGNFLCSVSSWVPLTSFSAPGALRLVCVCVCTHRDRLRCEHIPLPSPRTSSLIPKTRLDITPMGHLSTYI